MSVALLRTAFVLISVVSAAFPGIAVYLILWLVIPEAAQDPNNPVRSKAARNIAILVLVFVVLVGLLAATLLAVRSGFSSSAGVPV